jgi:hypothetical protein
MQLFGKNSARDATVAHEAGRDCMACWLVGQWEEKGDARAKREDRYRLAAQIAEGKGKRIRVDDNVPIKQKVADNPLAAISTADLLAEIARRRANGENI